MRPSLLLLCLGLSATAQASSWFGSSEPAQPYTTWSVSELKSWLQAHNIDVPSKSPSQTELKALVEENWNSVSAWTYDQYASAQKSFADIRDASFDKWDESRLREFLLTQGIVAPKGPKEQLVHLAKSQYRAYTNAASTFSARASTAISGDSFHQATQSMSSLASQATDSAARALDDTKDYVYSTWDDNRIRSYLESKGVQVKDEAKQSRNHLLALMRDTYAKVTDPIYDAWSDSYLHDWLLSHNIISPAPPSPYSREYLLKKMKQYYYDANDTVFSSWSDSQLKEWLVKQGIVKGDAQIKRDKMLRLVQDNYLSAKSTVLSAWSDSQIRDWLVEHKYVDDRNAAQIKRDELIKLFSDKYNAATTPSYHTWPDARLRAYLRQHNIPEDKLPTSRPGLLQETRIRWVQTQTNTEALWAKVKDIVGGVEEGVEERLWRVWSVLKGNYGQGEKYAEEKYDQGKREAGEKYAEGKAKVGEKAEHGKKQAGEIYEDAKGEAGRRYSDTEKQYEKEKERAYEKGQEAREKVGEKVKTSGEKIKGEL
ncbi:hypothetical protein D9615_007739 [Tricholomella constricta]|uniref:Stress response protein ish1 n=1 Tax=Tricholomella constricta TaxID=117010 RepID=A0A8H5M0F4_9AGAR|nr:hypothetical protein D9615_007739 [Tricholomella constricta]